jgi:hypothetical protein
LSQPRPSQNCHCENECIRFHINVAQQYLLA